jgi:molybdenum cofactor guanylyltransferase
MSEKKYQKHTALARIKVGNFGRNEFALLGAPCEVIKNLANELIAFFSEKYQIAYLDAAHHHSAMPLTLAAGAQIDYSDNIDYQQVSFREKWTSFETQDFFKNMDLIVVNGNHHEAKQQVVLIDESKKASLEKRLSQLTDVQLFILKEKNSVIFDFLKENIIDWEKIPVLMLDDLAGIFDFFSKKIIVAPLYGLVLAGGKSLRMGTDKGAIVWHNAQEQRYYVADMLKNLCEKTYISCRDEAQKNTLSTDYQYISDTFTNLGPYGAILSAFREHPNASWLVVACDLPLLDSETLEELIAQRDISSLATTFESPFDKLPEPLITIWESKSYATLLSFLAQGYSCPRKVLRNTKVKIIEARSPEKLTNVNTKEELETMDLKKQELSKVGFKKY